MKIQTMTTMYGFELRTEQGWDADACGEQNASNYFASEEAAMAELPNLAQVIDCSFLDLRVVPVEVQS